MRYKFQAQALHQYEYMRVDAEIEHDIARFDVGSLRSDPRLEAQSNAWKLKSRVVAQIHAWSNPCLEAEIHGWISNTRAETQINAWRLKSMPGGSNPRLEMKINGSSLVMPGGLNPRLAQINAGGSNPRLEANPWLEAQMD